MKTTKPDKDGVMQIENFKVKEGCTIKLRATFKVYNDTVLGLDFRGEIKYKDMKSVAKDDLRIGSFGPIDKAHVEEFAEVELPSGFFARTHYTGTGQFVDSEDRVHYMFRYQFDLASDW